VVHCARQWPATSRRDTNCLPTVYKVLKFLVIIIGSFFGAVFLVIQWMQAREYIQGQIDWNKVGNDTMTWFQSLSAQVSSSHIFGALGIPATSGLAIGLMAGLAES